MQAAALAEFRADWATAVRTYQTAYAEVARCPVGGATPLQRWAELTAVAELVHLKARCFGLHVLVVKPSQGHVSDLIKLGYSVC